jgi:predicted CoA-binding protein
MECAIQKPIENIEAVKEALKDAKIIAVVGLSPDESKDSNRVAKYLQNAGYKIVPVYPKEETILGEKVYKSLSDIPFAVDIVNVFRKGDALDAVVDESIKIGAKFIWAQIGCHDDAAEAKAKAAGMLVISNRCIMVDRKRLLGD